MAERTTQTAGGRTRSRWPYQGAPQALLLLAGLVTMAASFLPWISTPFGAMGVRGAGPIVENASYVTLYAGFLATPGAVWRQARVVMIHAIVLAVPAVILPLVQLGWGLANLPALGAAWVPGPGMVLVLVSGLVAVWSAIRLGRGPRVARG
jgi:hypothetical protein